MKQMFFATFKVLKKTLKRDKKNIKKTVILLLFVDK